MLPLDSTLLITHGNPLSVGALFAHIYPEKGVFTGVCCEGEGELPLIGQVHYKGGERSARLSFVIPSNSAEETHMAGLFETLAVKAGDWGAFNLLAEVNELAPAFLGLRKASFSVYGWQRLWQLQFPEKKTPGLEGRWQAATSADEISVRSLAQMLVPPLAQGADPFPGRQLQGFVHYQNSEVVAYIESVFGSRGILLVPLIHPSVENAAGLILELEQFLFPLLMRPVFLTVRSYQAWLETAFENLGWKAAPRQALMVKHLAKAQTVVMPIRQAVIEHAPAPLGQNYTCPKN